MTLSKKKSGILRRQLNPSWRDEIFRELPLPDHHPGVIRLKLHPQRWQWVSTRVAQFLQTTNEEELRDKLVILYNDRVRIR